MGLHIDFETRSILDLSKCGADAYAAHPSTSVLCMAYAFGDGEVKLWNGRSLFPANVCAWVDSGQEVVAHNGGSFELLIWNQSLRRQVPGVPQMKIEQIKDTMAMAYAMALPGSLARSAGALGLEQEKDMTGRRVMLQLCRPRSENQGITTWYEPDTDPDKYDILYKYCIQDVEVERGLTKRLLPLSDFETKLWHTDHHINRRGVKVDVPLAKSCILFVEDELERLNIKMQNRTDGVVFACTEVSRIMDYCAAQNYPMATMDKASVSLALSDENCPQHVKEVLRLRQLAAKTSTAKIKAMVEGLDSRGRLCGMFQYHGASTGRWAGRRVQLQNLPRPTISEEEISLACEVMVSSGGHQFFREMFDEPLSAVSSMLRAMLIPEDGYRFVGCDYSSIEARVLAWLAGQEDKLELFASGGKVYETAASKIFHVPVSEVTEYQRLVGKVAELALGYQGGSRAFSIMGAAYNVSVSEAQAESIKTAWRNANPHIVQFWERLQQAFEQAIRDPGNVKTAGKIQFVKKGSFGWAKLPSGRVICYPYPKITEGKFGSDAISYQGWRGNAWGEVQTFGGKLCENVTQAVARDLLAESLVRLKDESVVMHVHDEIVCETKTLSPEALEKAMLTPCAWAEGLPIAAKAWEASRFRK